MIIFSIAFIIMLLFIATTYNGLIRRKNETENAFGSVDAQLKKRYDLIPNLVETVKQFTAHEKELLTKVTELRTKANSGGLTNKEKLNLDQQISSVLGNIMVSLENYPDIKSSENFLNLQRTLNEVESQISAARRTYNAVITDYNNGIETFPNNLIAKNLNMFKKEVFVISETERENVTISKLF